VKNELDIGDETVVDWYNFVKDICGLWVTDHGGLIGGTDPTGNAIEVQIDESKFMHRKFHKGRFAEGHWVFGGIEVGVPHPNCFLEVCPGNRRNAATLLPLITKWVAPGSVVVSDMWAAYGGVRNLPGGYQHLTVNHSLNFLDPITGAHTNNAEGQWSQVKRKFRAMNGTSDALFPTYLLEYMWRKEHMYSRNEHDVLDPTLLYFLAIFSDVNKAWRVKAKTQARTKASKAKTQARTKARKAKTQAETSTGKTKTSRIHRTTLPQAQTSVGKAKTQAKTSVHINCYKLQNKKLF